MKGIFIYYNKIENNHLSGIDKKVISQVETFNNFGLDCEMIFLDTKTEKNHKRILNKFLTRLPYFNLKPKWEYVEDYEKVDFVYFRRPLYFTRYTIMVLKKIRINNPNVKIILEFPNFPYDSEILRNISNIPLYIKDRYNRNKLKRFVDRIAVQNNVDSIFGVPTLKFTNGINVQKIPVRIPIDGLETINICAVAS